jgi:hypothetical protein
LSRIAICSAIVSGTPIFPHFRLVAGLRAGIRSARRLLEDTSADNILRVVDVAVVMRTALRGWRSFDIRSPLLIYVNKANRCSLASLASTENFISRREARACPVAKRHKPIHHGGSHQRKPQSAQPCGARTSY